MRLGAFFSFSRPENDLLSTSSGEICRNALNSSRVICSASSSGIAFKKRCREQQTRGRKKTTEYPWSFPDKISHLSNQPFLSIRSIGIWAPLGNSPRAVCKMWVITFYFRIWTHPLSFVQTGVKATILAYLIRPNVEDWGRLWSPNHAPVCSENRRAWCRPKETKNEQRAEGILLLGILCQKVRTTSRCTKASPTSFVSMPKGLESRWTWCNSTENSGSYHLRLHGS